MLYGLTNPFSPWYGGLEKLQKTDKAGMKVYEKSEEYKKQAVLYRKEKFMDLVGNTDFISGRLPVSGGKGRTFGKREAEGGHVSAVAFSVLPVRGNQQAGGI